MVFKDGQDLPADAETILPIENRRAQRREHRRAIVGHPLGHCVIGLRDGPGAVDFRWRRVR
jgi:hypothetical protein